MLVGGAYAQPRAIKGCPGVKTAASDKDIAAELGRTYAIKGTDLRVCVYRALYPYSLKKGHELWACYVAARGSKSKDVCGHGDSFLEYEGFRIEVRMRTPRYTEESDVWLRVEKLPPKRPLGAT